MLPLTFARLVWLETGCKRLVYCLQGECEQTRNKTCTLDNAIAASSFLECVPALSCLPLPVDAQTGWLIERWGDREKGGEGEKGGGGVYVGWGWDGEW